MLTTNKKVMTWFCMLPPDKSTNKRQRIAFFLVALTALTLNVGCLTGSTAYVVKNRPTDLKGSLFELIGVIASGNSAYIGIIGIIQRHKLAIIYEKLSNIHDSIKSERFKRPLTEANETCEWMWKRYLLIISSTSILFQIFALISIFLCWWTYGDFNVKHFYHPLNIILPWNQTTYLGYLAEIIFSDLIGVLYFITAGAVLLLFISMYIYYQKFFEMFELIVQSLNSKQIRRTKVLLCDLIRFRASIQELFIELTKVYSPFVMVQLISGAALLTISACFFDLKLEHIDSSLGVIIISLGNCICVLFMYCYFGTLTTERFQKMADTLNESNWRDFPVHLQKYFIIMIADMRRPIRYHGLGIINLDLKTFISLIRAVYSYYIALKA